MMTDKDTTEGNFDREPSTSATGQPLSNDALKVLQSQVETITAKLAESEKRWQSDKDKRIPKIEEEVGSLRKTIEEALKLGNSNANADEIERQIKLNRLLSQTDESGNLVGRRIDTPTTNQPTEAQRIAKSANLDLNDKDIAGAVESGDLVKLFQVVQAKGQTSSASASDAPPPGGGSVPGKATDKELIQAYQSEMLNAPRGRAGQSTRDAIREKYRKQNVPVDAVVFQ